MNEQLFLKQLQLQLRGLPNTEIEEIIQGYESYFAEAREAGIAEEEAVKNLGRPLEIARDIKESRKQDFSSYPTRKSDVGSFMVGFGLILFNLLIVLGPVLGIIGGFIGMFVSCLVFIISPLLIIGSLILQHGHLFELFFSLLLCGIGILALPYLLKLAEKGQHLLKKYIQWNMNLVKGEVM